MPALAVRERNPLPPPAQGDVVRFPPRGGRKPRPDADALALLLAALDVRIVPNNATRGDGETKARGTLQRMLDQHGAEHTTMAVRTIVESHGNSRALIDPVIAAVSAVMIAFPAWPATGLRFIEAFDGFDLFATHQMVRPLKPADPARSAIAGIIVARLWPVFCQPPIKREKAIRPPKISGAQRAIEKGRALLAAKGPHGNSRLPRDALERLGLDPGKANYYINAARRYGDRPELVARLSRVALFELARPSLPAAVRAEVERRLAAGERVKATEIQRLRRA